MNRPMLLRLVSVKASGCVHASTLTTSAMDRVLGCMAYWVPSMFVSFWHHHVSMLAPNEVYTGQFSSASLWDLFAKAILAAFLADVVHICAMYMECWCR